ncbi:band 3 anion transport protein [Parasteatoda tepidariorum]|uniref:band 3 anion transport protein n=1 Tax=Parasteatoda tepidariorum TaxID=114398 RepID=UPI00077F9524|nr:band 3 anion transport protein [Parasteatoda tepidariorum]XP_042897162.1 band 3 anion transport protein [Parasteatoda tepidariorum]XP_042897163.1 band 3 anion transport protein [Parasteatoda tepidariorum]XP_042897164.1 band 3 anion transport protein [Parasteatoda tepidariorum]XP_042897165.1 band 3 anion transport protein [Parasteatoda tepidariorum]XP_042897166.1 band 3 anion transport protein [Parasteatoda tepidariorum]
MMERRNSNDDKRYSVANYNYNRSNSNERKHWRDEDLDEEMEDIFHPPAEQCSIANLSSDGEIEGRVRFDENDYNLHRRESFQYHQPLRKLYHHKHKKSYSRKSIDESASHMSKVPEEQALELSKEKEKAQDAAVLLDGVTDNSLQANQVNSSKENNHNDKVQFYVGSSSSLEHVLAPPSESENNNKSHKPPLKSVLRGLLSGPIDLNLSKDSSTSPKEDKGGTVQETAVDAGDATKVLKDSSCTFDLSKPKVKFMLGEESKNDLQKEINENSKPSKHRSYRRHSVRRKHHGFNIDVKNYTTVLEPEEAETLQTADIDDMASHRFEDPKGIRRHLIQDKASVASLLNSTKEDGAYKTIPFKKVFDHDPHENFVELHELQVTDLVTEWRETARWIKYEEDVEFGPNRWGKPKVPPLKFHSMLKLRQCLEQGSVLLDLDEKDFFSVAQRVVENLVVTDQIEPDEKEYILQILMNRHRHMNDKSMPMRRNSSGYGNLNLLSHDKNRSPIFNKPLKFKQENDLNKHHDDDHETSPSAAETVILMPNNNHHTNVEITPSKSKNLVQDKSNVQGILKRLPENSEGSVVLVGTLETLDRPICTFVRLGEGTKMANLLEVDIKIRFIFMLLGPSNKGLDYREIGRSMSSLINNKDFIISAYKANNRNDFLHAIHNFLDNSVVLPPGNWDSKALLPVDEIRRKSLVPPKRIKDQEEDKPPPYDPLKRTGKIFGGFIQDIKNRYPFYCSDLKDSFNFQCIASILFIYFAAVSGAIAFGGLLSEKTNQNIGVTETLLGTSTCGIIFSLFAGQPLIIIGTTAPLVLIDETLYQYQEYYSSEYLVIRVWVGIWIAVIAITLVAAEGSILVKFFSRFVQEIFATMIALIFIYESAVKVVKIFNENPLLSTYPSLNETYVPIFTNDTNSTEAFVPPKIPHPNTALLSLILTLGTFYLAFSLRHFRNSHFLGRNARRALGDFGVPIAIVIMVLIDYCIPNTYTEKLIVPEGLSPSTDRSWIISPFPVKAWEVAGAFVIAILVFILVFLETQIVELILSKKKLKKGSGFHLDMVIVGIINAVSGFIGGPWLCAACVRSITHASSLTIYSKTHAPGETPHIIDIKEQRITNFMVSFLVGASILMAPLLRQVPFCVLFGVFLYMGISSLSGIHLYERFLLIFMHKKHFPDFSFVRKVKISKMHTYTGIQIVAIVVIWVVKEYATLAFPFALLSMIAVHASMKTCWNPEEMKALDEEGEEAEQEDEPDFYEQMVV